MHKVAVIVPIYNKEQRLASTIESVLNQTFKDFQLILVNDGSIDNSKKIIKEYQKRDSRIVYIEQENQGVSIARNVGIDNSFAEYVSFLDAGDIIGSNFLERMLLKITDSNVCFCGHYNVVDGAKVKARFKYFEGDVIEKYFYNICTPNTNSWLIKKSYLHKHEIKFSPNISWGEDMEFFAKVLFHEKNVKCVNDYLSYYVRDKTNTLSENNLGKIYKDICWLEKLKNYFIRYEADKQRLNKIITSIETYRLPANIINRLKMNINLVGAEEIINNKNKTQEYIKKLRFTNGLRSLKLIYNKILLELSIVYIKIKRN